jgi:pimeloyl-ACP methyl ester carboxylesterase
VFGDFPRPPQPSARLGEPETVNQVRTTTVLIHPETDLPVPALLRSRGGAGGQTPACVLLHLDGKSAALRHPLAAALVEGNWTVLAPDLRATGETRPASDAIAGAADHNSAEHALWLGRPLLGQWVFDVLCLLDWLALQPGLDRRHFAVVGLGQAGVVALCAAGLLEDRVHSAAAVGAPVSYVTDQAYGSGTRMGLLAPGILKVGDICHLAALAAPRRLFVVEGVTPQGQAVAEQALRDAFAFTASIYRLHRAEARLTATPTLRVNDLVTGL